jgi:2'-5' RNA ligase
MRLFLAINLPTDVRETLWEVAAPLRTARYPVRWVAAEAIHLTLKFLGDVDDMREDEIAAGVAAAVVGAKPFPLPVGGFGAFPSAQRPRVVWAGLEPVPSLELLQHRVEQEMERLGFPTEGRPFHPHLTLGRVKRDARPAALAGLAGVRGVGGSDAEHADAAGCAVHAAPRGRPGMRGGCLRNALALIGALTVFVAVGFAAWEYRRPIVTGVRSVAGQELADAPPQEPSVGVPSDAALRSALRKEELIWRRSFRAGWTPWRAARWTHYG